MPTPTGNDPLSKLARTRKAADIQKVRAANVKRATTGMNSPLVDVSGTKAAQQDLNAANRTAMRKATPKPSDGAKLVKAASSLFKKPK